MLLARADAVEAPSTNGSGTVFALITQGRKRISVGDRVLEYGPGQYLVASVDVPITGHYSEASPDRPALGFGLVLRPAAIASLLLEAPPGVVAVRNSAAPPAIGVADAEPELMRFGRLRVDREAHRAWVDDKEVGLTALEGLLFGAAVAYAAVGSVFTILLGRPLMRLNYDQADREAHGGPDKAIYAYAIEDARWWEDELGRSLSYGEFGENLTTEGIEVNNALVGERWEIGTTVLEVSEPRVPCWRLAVRMNDKLFPRRFTEALRPGPYLRIVVEGNLGAGDAIRVVAKPNHDLTIRDVFRIYTRDRDEVERLLEVPQMSESWKRWARDWQRKSNSRPSDSSEPGCC